jgi:hypothetical protein
VENAGVKICLDDGRENFRSVDEGGQGIDQEGNGFFAQFRTS